MDNSVAEPTPVDNTGKTWGPTPAVLWTTSIAAGIAVAVTVLFALSGDGPGALLAGAACAALLIAAALGLRMSPRLTADANGIGVRGFGGLRLFPWRLVTVALVTTRRLGRDVTVLELDIGGHDPRLYVLGWIELGADPDDVLADLERIRLGG